MWPQVSPLSVWTYEGLGPTSQCQHLKKANHTLMNTHACTRTHRLNELHYFIQFLYVTVCMESHVNILNCNILEWICFNNHLWFSSFKRPTYFKPCLQYKTNEMCVLIKKQMLMKTFKLIIRLLKLHIALIILWI